jgi:hypothetical protein
MLTSIYIYVSFGTRDFFAFFGNQNIKVISALRRQSTFVEITPSILKYKRHLYFGTYINIIYILRRIGHFLVQQIWI